MDVAALSAELDQLREENETLTRRIQELLEALRLQIHRQYGASSEQAPPEQSRLFDEPGEALDAETEMAPADDGTVRPRRAGRRGTQLSPDLPRVEVIHDLDDEEKVCTEHGCDLEPMGEAVSEQFEFIPAQVRVIKNIRRKYTCPACEGNVVTAKCQRQLKFPHLGRSKFPHPSIVLGGQPADDVVSFLGRPGRRLLGSLVECSG